MIEEEPAVDEAADNQAGAQKKYEFEGDEKIGAKVKLLLFEVH